jgi:hypothetical protein
VARRVDAERGAAVSEPCSARSARPRGESMRFCASHTGDEQARRRPSTRAFPRQGECERDGGTAMPSARR